MPRYIDADKLIEDIRDHKKEVIAGGYIGTAYAMAHDHIIDLVNVQRSCDVQEVKHGKWKIEEDEYRICATEFTCSCCGEGFCTSELTDEEFIEFNKYCPNCGAQMDGKEE